MKRIEIQESHWEFIQGQAQETGRPVNTIVDELLSQSIHIAQNQRGKGEAPALSAIRQVMREELGSQLNQHTDTLASLLFRACRDNGIVRRLIYASLARGFGVDFAMKAYRDAQAKAGKELAQNAQPLPENEE